MQLGPGILFRAAVLGCTLLGQAVMAIPPHPPDRADLQLFVTAFAKDNSAAVLQTTDLSVLVDKTPAQVKSVRAAKDDPLLFAVVVDISRSDAPMAEGIKQAAFQIFQHLASARNQGYLVLFNSVVAVSPGPISMSQAKQTLDSASFQEGGTAVYDAIEQTCKQELSRPGSPANPRRVILLISDGEDNASRVTHARAEETALEEGVSVFSLITKGPLAGPQGEEFLREVSERTGGFSTDKELNKAVLVLLAAIDAQSIISFVPPQPADGKLHSVQIKCTHKGVHIHAPSGALLQ